MIIKLGKLEVKVGGKKKSEPEPDLLSEPMDMDEFTSLLTDGVLYPEKFFGGTKLDPIEEASQRTALELALQQQAERQRLALEEKEKERKRQERELNKMLREIEKAQEAERERLAQPCPECGGTGHCLHKELRNMRPDLYK